MPTNVRATPDDNTPAPAKTCAHAFAATTETIWLYRAKSGPESPLKCPSTAELRSSSARLSRGGTEADRRRTRPRRAPARGGEAADDDPGVDATVALSIVAAVG